MRSNRGSLGISKYEGLISMLTTTLEAILFAAAKPVAIAQLKKQLGASDIDMETAIAALREHNRETSGIHLLEQEGKLQLITNPALGADVAAFLKKEASGPLTRPALETLAVIVYQGPVTKPEIEQVRGVNCALILRNLLIRGFIEEREDKARLQNVYVVSLELLREMGVHRVEELPEFSNWHGQERIKALMAKAAEGQEEICPVVQQ